MPDGNRGRGNIGGPGRPISGIAGRGGTRGGARGRAMTPIQEPEGDRCDDIRDPRARRMCKMQQQGPGDQPPITGPAGPGGGVGGARGGFRGRAGGGRRRRY